MEARTTALTKLRKRKPRSGKPEDKAGYSLKKAFLEIFKEGFFMRYF